MIHVDQIQRSLQIKGSGRRSAGHEAALEHIRQANQLSQELGGTDKDVKSFFFRLTPASRQKVLDLYGKKYGTDAKRYAEETMPKWRSGQVAMSGMVAERLFNLLPPLMPIETKYMLTESLWQHVGPSSTKNFYVGKEANPAQISHAVANHLEEVVVRYEIPSQMQKRFDWLAQGDVGVKQQLLNHFREQEKLLLCGALELQLPTLLNHLNSNAGANTTSVREVVQVGKHTVNIEVCEGLGEAISDVVPRRANASSDSSWIWWLVGAGLLALMFMG